MPFVQDVLREKGTEVQTVAPEASVLQAIGQMNQQKIGALVVTQADRIVGIFTERDVLRRVVCDPRRPQDITVAEVMTSEVVCCPPTADLDDISAIIKNRRIRHVPICGDDGRLIGLISIGDVNAYHVSNQEATILGLNEYIYGRA
jgi:CBS domain-containing protein